MEAVLLRGVDMPYPWSMACDANMEPETFVHGMWLSERTMIARAPAANISTRRSKGSEGVDAERM